jgi:hypothetical protein
MTKELHPVPSDADSNEYATPRRITRKLAETLPTDGDKFDLDSASGAEKEPHAHNLYTLEDDGLRSEWFGWVWCNPPWSSPANDGRMKEAWLRRATGEIQRECVDGVVMLLPDDVSTEWFCTFGPKADYVSFIGRIKFGDVGRNPSFGVMLLTWGDVPDATVDALADMGPTYEGPALQGSQQQLDGFGGDSDV